MGSANLILLPGVQESLAGRVEILHLNPLSEQEKQHGKNSLLKRLIEGRIKKWIFRAGRGLSVALSRPSAVVDTPNPILEHQSGRGNGIDNTSMPLSSVM